MTERLKILFEDFEKAYMNLKEAVKSARSDLEIDGAIKRFELCYELTWKLIKEYLAHLGIICNNPRECFKQAYQNNIIEDLEIWLALIDYRNLLVHTYTSEQSREIFEKIKSDFVGEFKKLYDKVRREVYE
ncbi:MAG: hypothetical protein PWQ59_1526 [Thermoanaerobacterium sp.]|uniref:DUF86 domain-containing protein n=1 Tax=Thermodesulfobacterium commune TaxID=1741 RepID=A0A3B8N2Z0_9BACT|nr:HI0074 family nucleotidyltransferase substrate-binding subunit [Thermodesulfobacterium thermophilum]MDI3478001.1 hypothetical protein [Thermoanaerobacterium sp.]MDK2811978.1 hypothetical protein [Petrotoga sp.]HAA83485.1 DUF86 domain-containing protein [Thermodesulfobacterium commune]HCP10092.1 DUF86 domain-containing protein [Thermodesulfobacterium commune]